MPLGSLETVDLGFDCDSICKKILENKKHWIERKNSFYTFGAASYLDNKMEYFLRKRKSNPILKSLFSDIYEKIADHFNAELNDELAYPGFHIFDIRSKNNEARIHIDDQYEELPFDSDNLSEPKSFTIAFKKPKGGCGLNYWPNIDLQGTKSENRCKESDLNRGLEEKPSYQEYNLGIMYVHNRHILHQIANKRIVDEYEQRITLQGHVIKDNGNNGKKYIYF